MALLGEDEIVAGLERLEGWTRQGDAIRREWQAPSFLDGVARVAQVAELAEQADHHPDIDIRWRTLTFALSTHSEGGLTHKDLDLATQIDAVLR